MSNKIPLKILMLEDDALDFELNKAQLALLPEYHCDILWVKDRNAFLDGIYNYEPDIILSDYNLPQYNGMEALIDLNNTKKLIPFIFVTGTLNEETAAGTIKNGAWDYVVKDRLFRLPLAIKAVLELKEERKRTIESQEQNRILSMALEQSPVHIIISKLDGEIVYVNKHFIESTGFEFEEVMGKNIRNVVPLSNSSEEWSSDLWNGIIIDGNKWRGEIENRTKSGDAKWEFVSISQLKNKDEKITHHIVVKEDITHRKKIENEIILAKEQAEKSDRLKETFLQNLSHEIRTPMNSIVGFSSLLNQDDIEIDMVKEYANLIQDNSNKLLTIVNDILTISKIQTGQEPVITGPVYINDVIDKLYQKHLPFASDKDLNFQCFKDKDNPVPVILTDESKLSHILSSLIDNAIKFTNHGEVTLSSAIENQTAIFKIVDSGIGIPTNALSHIFDRFRQADPTKGIIYGGTGIGLSICKSYVSMLGGSINVESHDGKGSTFTVMMPYQNIEV